jgi:hypothetical protein
MIRRIGLVAAATLLALAGCSDPPTSGTVTHKQYSAAYDYITYMCITYGQYGCTSYMPIFNHMPASYQICVDGTDKHGKQASGCIEMDPASYATYREGDHYPKDR